METRSEWPAGRGDLQRRTERHRVLLHLLRVLPSQLGDALRVLPQGVCVLGDIERQELGIGQQEDEPASHLRHGPEPLEGRVVKLLHYLEGLVHTVVHRVAAVVLGFLNGHTTVTVKIISPPQSGDSSVMVDKRHVSHLVLGVSGSACSDSEPDEISLKITARAEFTDPAGEESGLIH